MVENPIDILKRVKNDLKKCAETWDFLKNIDNTDYEKARLIILNICKEDDMEVPAVIKISLEMEEFLTYIYDGNTNQNEAFLIIQETFNPFIDIVRQKSITVQFIPVEFNPPIYLSYSHIRDELKKCDIKILENDYAGAITNARSLLEGVFKEIIFTITGEHPNLKNDLVKLSNDARKALNLDPSKQEIVEPLKQVITGLASTVQGLGTIRNVISDSHSRKYEPDAHHAILVVNASKTVASFMFGTFQYQQVKGILKKEVKQPN
ncbi:abortive infection family protein [Paenibacillus sp. FSL H8-0332]|uniref:abortive infection family protein n=1 Tax=Paenibacillus sp. FSL H8-0332 TaxID=2954742 RepID=UPI0030D10E15